MTTLARWLERIGLAQYAELFAAHDIDLEVLPHLTDQDLKELGLSLGHRRKLLAAIEPLRTAPVPSPTSGSDQPIPRAPERPDAERRQLTVMFCDLVGSTDLASRLDPEDLRNIVRAYQETAAEVIRRFDGSIAQYLGDGILVYFGYPHAHEDDARRAVQAGLEIINGLSPFSRRLETAHGVGIAVRVGIHTGPAVVGAVGGADRQEHLALGETPNIAARIQSEAAPNTVVIGAATARLIRGAFNLEARGTRQLKGVAEPFDLLRVVGPTDAEGPDEEVRGVRRTPLVGRDEEVGLLVRRWEQSKERFGQVVLVSGEPGIGKSRLVTTIRDHVGREGPLHIVYRCSPYHTNSALYPVITHLHRVLQWRPDEPPGAKLDRLERMLDEVHLRHEGVVPLVATLLSVPLDDRYRPLRLTPQQEKQQTMDALVAWLMESADREPLLAVWEDLHWADPTTIEFLGLVIDQSPTAAILNVLTYRPEFVPPWPMRSHMTPLTLNRLERAQVEAMITALAHKKRLPAEVLRHIVGKTDGVPLFVEELTKMVLESAWLYEREDRYELAGPLPPLAIPTTLQDSLMARLDRLPTVREVAQLGAVLGREFAYEMLRVLSATEEGTLQDGLARAVSAELLYQRGRPPRSRYVFKHALIQDAAYQSLLKSTRRQYHGQIAQVLGERFPEIADHEPELLAHHYTEAGLAEPATRWWLAAGQRALRRSAIAEAVSHVTKGLELLGDVPEGSDRLQRELALQMALGPALMATRGFASAEVARAYTRARELCRQLGETPQLPLVQYGLFRLRLIRAELREARALAEELLALAERQNETVLRLTAHRTLGNSLMWLGDVARAREHLDQGSALYDRHQHRSLAFLYGDDPGVDCLVYGALARWWLGFPDQARAHGDAGLALARELAHPPTLARALLFSCWVHALCQETQVAQGHAEALVGFASDHRLAQWEFVGHALLGGLLSTQGEDERALRHLQQGLAGYDATQTVLTKSWILASLAQVHATAGRTEQGRTALREAFELVDITEERWMEAELHRLAGVLALMPTDRNEANAEASFHRALEIARRQGAKSLELRAATSLARLWQRQGRTDDARQLLADVYGWFTEGFDTGDLQAAKALLDELS